MVYINAATKSSSGKSVNALNRERLIKEMHDISKALSDERMSLESIRSEMLSEKKELESLRVQISDGRKSLSSVLSRTKTATDSFEESVRSHNAIVKTLKDSIAPLEERKKNLNDECDFLAKTLDERDALQSQIKQLNADVKLLNDSLEQMRSMHHDEEKRLDDKIESSKSLLKEIDEKMAKNAIIEAQAQEKLGIIDQAAKLLQSHYDAAKVQIDILSILGIKRDNL